MDDLIHYYPRGYEIFGEPVPISEVEEGKVCTICGSVFGRVQVSPGKGRQITTVYLKDLTGTGHSLCNRREKQGTKENQADQLV